jgi:hypothetical protein
MRYGATSRRGPVDSLHATLPDVAGAEFLEIIAPPPFATLQPSHHRGVTRGDSHALRACTKYQFTDRVQDRHADADALEVGHRDNAANPANADATDRRSHRDEAHRAIIELRHIARHTTPEILRV